MNWLILGLAGILEVVWAVGLKYTDGFSRLLPSVGVVVAIATSMFLLAVAMRSLPVSIAYAVWTGIGIVGTAVVGMTLGEPVSAMKVVCLAMILTGIMGLRMLS